MNRSAVAQINLDALRHNLSLVKQHAPNSRIMCAVKANAYGHGLLECANSLEQADGFAVTHVAEAVLLRQNGIKQTLFVLHGPVTQEHVVEFERHRLTAVIHHEHQLSLIKHADLDIWLKVNTGMNRLGFQPEQLDTVIAEINTYSTIRLQGLFTHMADADYAAARNTTDKQLALINRINTSSLPLSIANSASLLHWPASQETWVRPGVMLYGVNPFLEPTENQVQLQPVMTLKAPIIAINTCYKGASVGYGATWQAQRDSKIALIAIGYGDGYPRHAKNGTPVLINGVTCPLVGRVSMDLITVDVTDAPDVQIGQSVVLWGQDSEDTKKYHLPVEKVAKCADTIAYELLCSMYGRVNYQYN